MDKEAVNELAKQFGVAIDWSQKNIMPQINDLINRYAEYRITVDTIWCVACAVLITIVVIIAVITLWRNREYNGSGDVVFTLFMASIFVIPLAVGLGCGIEAIVGWKCCPEVMILKAFD